MTIDRRVQIGRLGERLAGEHLEQLGYRIIERNFRTRAGEIDLIASNDATLVFCEVKTLVARSVSGQGPTSPLESIRPSKRAQVRRLARAWLSERPAGAGGYAELRFDAIGILLTRSGQVASIEHLEAAF